MTDHFSNEDRNIYVLKNMGRVAGAAMARYSRSAGSLRDVIANEFMVEGGLSQEAADKLVERVLIAFGDDSVGELEGAHVCLENISMLATKILEHRRIGLSPIEKSSRYVSFTKKVNGDYRYHIPSELDGMDRTAYKIAMDGVFGAYVKMFKSVRSKLTHLNPVETAEYNVDGTTLTNESTGEDHKAFMRIYRNDIKTKACDITRAYLPLATTTNVGLYGNGRAYQHVISKLLSGDLQEYIDIGVNLKKELSEVMPHYVRRADENEYQIVNRMRLVKYGQEFDEVHGTGEESVELVEQIPNDYKAWLAAHCMYPYTKGSLQSVYDTLRESPQEAQKAIDMYAGNRETRRDRPERGFETGYPLNFDLVTEWAVYKDLMRHRMGTIQHQAPTVDLGFNEPDFIKNDPALRELSRAILWMAEHLYRFLYTKCPEVAQYAVLHGHNIRWSLSMNPRALMHLVELRTTPQGHPNYRRVAVKLFKLVQEKYPWLADTFKFVNTDDVFWSRADSEARQEAKRRRLNE